MPTIVPVSDLRNYGNVLEKVNNDEPVYLTKNGYGVYSIRKIEDEEKIQKAFALLRLMEELNKGIEEADNGKLHSDEETIALLAKKGIKIE